MLNDDYYADEDEDEWYEDYYDYADPEMCGHCTCIDVCCFCGEIYERKEWD